MYMKDWKQKILTIPNLLSLFRLALIPVYVRLYLCAHTATQYLYAGMIITLSCLTDLLDGRIARRFHMITPLGKILDPLADKMTQFVLMLCLSLRYPSMKQVLILLLIKELFQLTLAIVNFSHGRMLPGALPAGKVCTAVLFFSLILMVMFPSLPSGVSSVIAVVDGGFLLVAFLHYLYAFGGKHTPVQDLNRE